MSVIYSYPIKGTPVGDDLILISDSASSPQFATKQVKVSTLPFTNNAGTVTSVGVSMPSAFAVANSPVTSSGTIAITTTGGSSGQYLAYDGTWGTPAGGAANAAGADTEVQYNDGGTNFGAGAFFTTNKSSKVDITYELGLKGDGGSNQGLLKLYCEAGTAHHVGIKGPNHTGGTPVSYTIQLPNSLPSVANQILESNASGTLSWIATPTGGGALPIEEEGSQITAAAAKINFTGTGATASASGNDVTVDIPAMSIQNSGVALVSGITTLDFGTSLTPTSAGPGTNKVTIDASSGGISFSGSTANGIATYSSATTANVSSNLTIDNTNKKLSIGSTYSIQDLSGAFNIGSLSTTQNQENISFYINGSEKVKIDEDGRLVSSVGTAANPNLKFGTGNDGIYGTSNTVQIVTNGTSKISVSDGNTADIQMNDLVEFGYGLKFGAAGNTLSTYEEGTWTPTPYDSGGNPTTAVALGTYIRVGDLVNCYFYLNITSSGSTPGAAMVIQSLPYAGNNINGQRGGVIISRNDGTNYVQQQATSGLVEASNLRLKRILSASATSTKLTDASWYASATLNYTLEGTVIYKIA